MSMSISVFGFFYFQVFMANPGFFGSLQFFVSLRFVAFRCLCLFFLRALRLIRFSSPRQKKNLTTHKEENRNNKTNTEEKPGEQ